MKLSQRLAEVKIPVAYVLRIMAGKHSAQLYSKSVSKFKLVRKAEQNCHNQKEIDTKAPWDESKRYFCRDFVTAVERINTIKAFYKSSS